MVSCHLTRCGYTHSVLGHARPVTRRARRVPCDALEETSNAKDTVILEGDSLRWRTQTWNWNGSDINYAVAGSGDPVLLVHGFGASLGHWRNNIPALAENYQIYAIDLLGFGASDKPVVEYSIELWADLVADFSSTVVKSPLFMVGNSIGSLISLQAAENLLSSDRGPSVKGVALVNCAGGLNNTARLEDIRVRAALPLLWLINAIVSYKPTGTWLYENFRQRENVRDVLKGLYCNKDAVDEELLDIICKPGDDTNALDVIIAVLTGPPGPKPEDIIEDINIPILALWGDTDALTPVDGPVGQFFLRAPERMENVEFKLLENTGHCAMDDNPEVVNEQLLLWMQGK